MDSEQLKTLVCGMPLSAEAVLLAALRLTSEETELVYSKLSRRTKMGKERTLRMEKAEASLRTIRQLVVKGYEGNTRDSIVAPLENINCTPQNV